MIMQQKNKNSKSITSSNSITISSIPNTTNSNRTNALPITRNLPNFFLASIFFLVFLVGCVRLENGNLALGNETMEQVQPSPLFPTTLGEQEGEEGCPLGEEDLDQDGICGGMSPDCDDSDAAIRPGVQERCDGVDNDCDNKIDEGCEVRCFDECAPEGQHCAVGSEKLKKCANVDDDPCLELLQIECTYGCSDGMCRTAAGTPLEETHAFARTTARPTSGQALRTPTYQINTEPCSGSLLGLAEWNEGGSLCRRQRFEDGSGGYLTPLLCCQRYQSRTTCVQDRGEVPYQAAGLSFKYHEVGCYGQGSNPAVS